MTQPRKAADLGITLPLLPLNREFTPRYGEVEHVAPGVRRVLARNPNPFTFHGTGTYLIGHGKVAVVDPGPLLEEHVAALLAAVAGETVTHILITHTHGDHSPAAAPLKRATGAPTFGFGPHGAGRLIDGIEVEEGGDRDFVPDVVVTDGDVIAGDGWEVECVHTPGHTSNHLCFAYREPSALFCGDHVMGWSTTVIVPPDGDMAEYFASLEKLRQRNDLVYYPTHGAPLKSPQAFVAGLIAHRHARERQIEACIAAGVEGLTEMVRVIYSEVDPRLHPAAAMSVRAHLAHLVSAGRLRQEGSRYRPGH
jgi:glyoxylase-like metal-dependent hydrolase (beta-lactamase superfamily II)